VVLEPSSPLGLDGKKVVFMHTCRLYMCHMCMHDDGHCYSCTVTRNLKILSLEYVCREFMFV